MNSTVAIPESLDELLTPKWLNAALSTRFPGVHVTHVTPGPVVERVSTNARFRIEGDLPEGLPPALCAKGYFSDVGRGAPTQACRRRCSTATSPTPPACAR